MSQLADHSKMHAGAAHKMMVALEEGMPQKIGAGALIHVIMVSISNLHI